MNLHEALDKIDIFPLERGVIPDTIFRSITQIFNKRKIYPGDPRFPYYFHSGGEVFLLLKETDADTVSCRSVEPYQPVGEMHYTALGSSLEVFDDGGKVVGITVKSHYRRRGIGTALIKYAMEITGATDFVRSDKETPVGKQFFPSVKENMKKIVELFDRDTSDVVVDSDNSSKGQRIVYFAVQDHNFELCADRDEDDEYGDLIEVSFSLVDRGYDHDLQNFPNQDMAFKIFSFVGKVVQEEVNKGNVRGLRFTANINEPSRIRFYRTLSKVVQRKLFNNPNPVREVSEGADIVFYPENISYVNTLKKQGTYYESATLFNEAKAVFDYYQDWCWGKEHFDSIINYLNNPKHETWVMDNLVRLTKAQNSNKISDYHSSLSYLKKVSMDLEVWDYLTKGDKFLKAGFIPSKDIGQALKITKQKHPILQNGDYEETCAFNILSRMILDAKNMIEKNSEFPGISVPENQYKVVFRKGEWIGVQVLSQPASYEWGRKTVPGGIASTCISYEDDSYYSTYMGKKGASLMYIRHLPFDGRGLCVYYNDEFVEISDLANKHANDYNDIPDPGKYPKEVTDFVLKFTEQDPELQATIMAFQSSFDLDLLEPLKDNPTKLYHILTKISRDIIENKARLTSENYSSLTTALLWVNEVDEAVVSSELVSLTGYLLKTGSDTTVGSAVLEMVLHYTGKYNKPPSYNNRNIMENFTYFCHDEPKERVLDKIISGLKVNTIIRNKSSTYREEKECMFILSLMSVLPSMEISKPMIPVVEQYLRDSDPPVNFTTMFEINDVDMGGWTDEQLWFLFSEREGVFSTLFYAFERAGNTPLKKLIQIVRARAFISNNTTLTRIVNHLGYDRKDIDAEVLLEILDRLDSPSDFLLKSLKSPKSSQIVEVINEVMATSIAKYSHMKLITAFTQIVNQGRGLELIEALLSNSKVGFINPYFVAVIFLNDYIIDTDKDRDNEIEGVIKIIDKSLGSASINDVELAYSTYTCPMKRIITVSLSNGSPRLVDRFKWYIKEFQDYKEMMYPLKEILINYGLKDSLHQKDQKLFSDTMVLFSILDKEKLSRPGSIYTLLVNILLKQYFSSDHGGEDTLRSVDTLTSALIENNISRPEINASWLYDQKPEEYVFLKYIKHYPEKLGIICAMLDRRVCQSASFSMMVIRESIETGDVDILYRFMRGLVDYDNVFDYASLPAPQNIHHLYDELKELLDKTPEESKPQVRYMINIISNEEVYPVLERLMFKATNNKRIFENKLDPEYGEAPYSGGELIQDGEEELQENGLWKLGVLR